MTALTCYKCGREVPATKTFCEACGGMAATEEQLKFTRLPRAPRWVIVSYVAILAFTAFATATAILF